MGKPAEAIAEMPCDMDAVADVGDPMDDVETGPGLGVAISLMSLGALAATVWWGLLWAVLHFELL